MSAKTNTKLSWYLTYAMSLFFGWLGVDRFMMRQIFTGLLKLVTFGGLGIWYLVDVILIATKHQFKNIEWDHDGNMSYGFALAVSILFGSMGADRFMMGQVGWGLLKLFSMFLILLLLPVGLIWWLVDVILVAIKYNFKGVVWEVDAVDKKEMEALTKEV